jgi:hypothetical protein|tara:strand:- start:99 stop:572 length:474 start_codon:yes stop_codon:yes gene_type:complete
MKNFKEVLNYFGEKNYLFDEIGNDIVVFKDVEWKDYYDLVDYKVVRELVSIDVDYNYMKRKKYDVIVVRDKKLYGNNNMDILFKKELKKYIGDDKKVLLSEYMNKFNNKGVFGLLYNFRSGRWNVNDYNDRFENWCRRSGMLIKEKIKINNRLWLVN